MNCKKCKFKEDKDGGYCYMWKDKPKDCHYHKAKKEPEYENTAADDYLDYLHDQW